MGSSKTPSEYVPVPQRIIDRAKERNYCFPNLRPSQRAQPFTGAESTFRGNTNYTDGIDIDFGVACFLAGITSPTMVLIHYQGYGTKLSTVIAELPPIKCWADRAFPRLDFTKPANWNHCPNFWGGFIIGIAKGEGVKASEVVDDQNSEYFLEVVKVYGVETILPQEFDSKLY